MAAQAFVNPRVVRWARERVGLTTTEAAERLDVSPDRIEDWERGDRYPTIRQAQTLAQRFFIPFGYLFLSDPPTIELPLPDLRTRAGRSPRSPSPELSDVINDAIRKQDWYRSYLEEEGVAPIPSIGRYSLQDDSETIAADIRATLGIDEDMRREARISGGLLRAFVHRAEAAGILVLRNGVVGTNTSRPLDPNEFQGFALSDELAPLVFVNTNDVVYAQIFTLAHEIAHLWLGQSGISDPDYRNPYESQDQPVERLCNHIAAEILLPNSDLDQHWSESIDIDENLREISDRYRVSRMVVLRKAYNRKKLTQDQYRHYSNILYGSARNRDQEKKKRGGGGNFYATLASRNSRTFTVSLIGALREGRILARDAARLLNVKMDSLEEVAKRIRNIDRHE